MHRNFQDEGLSIITSPSNPSHLKTSLPSLGNLNTNFFNEILHKATLNLGDGVLSPTSDADGGMSPTFPADGSMPPTVPAEGGMSPPPGLDLPTVPADGSMPPTVPAEGGMSPPPPPDIDWTSADGSRVCIAKGQCRAIFGIDHLWVIKYAFWKGGTYNETEVRMYHG